MLAWRTGGIEQSIGEHENGFQHLSEVGRYPVCKGAAVRAGHAASPAPGRETRWRQTVSARSLPEDRDDDGDAQGPRDFGFVCS